MHRASSAFPAALAAASVLSFSVVRSASADEATLSGLVATDFRAAVEGDGAGDLTWNVNTVGLNLKQRISAHIRYEADLRINFDGLVLAGEEHDLGALSNSLELDPFWLESEAAFITIKDIFEGFDIAFGRQIVTWGAADRFRPTNNLNPDDMWDPLRFGITQANEMIRFLYNPVGDLILEAVLIPAFRPARLPTTAALALTDPNGAVPFFEAELAERAATLRGMMGGLALTFGETTATVKPPDLSLENMQVGARVSWRMDETDFSLSFYRGFDDFPHPTYSQSDIVMEDGHGVLVSRAEVGYPEIMVGGFDIAGQIGFLDDAGFRIEGAVVYPTEEDLRYVMQMPRDPERAIDFGRLEGHSADYRPFFKCTVGMDYTFTRDIFVVAMYVHGMVDELGAQAVGDYVVVGGDFKFFNQALMLRVFALAQLSTEHPSFSIMPMLQWNPWSSMELELGGLVLWGDDRSKFGQPAAGDSFVFLRSRVRF